MIEQPRVVIDARMAHHTGIGRYIRGLIGGLDEIGASAQVTLLGPAAESDWAPASISRIDYDPPIYSVAEQFAGLRLCRDSRLSGQLFHFPHYNVPWWLPSRSVVSIHDLTHFLIKRSHSPLRLFLARRLLARAVDRAGAIIAVSNATAEALIDEFPRARAKLTTIHHGLGAQFERLDPLRVEAFSRTQALGRPLLLYVGNDRPHKNLDLFLRAAEELRSHLPALTVGLVGPIERDYTGRSWIRQRGTVPDDELVLWYNAAAALIQPSLNEGFGLTALEAMACGTPVAASRIRAHTEILGSDGKFFDPHRRESLIEAVLDLLRDESATSERVSRGRRRAAGFTWQRAARRTLELYREVGEGVQERA